MGPHMSKQLDNLVVFLLTHKVYNSLLFVKTFHIPPSSITMLISLGSFAGNREGPSQAFENPHRAICQSGVRGPAVSFGNRLQNAVSGPRLGRRWGGSWICILKLNEIIAEHAVCILLLNNVCFAEPNQAKRPVQQSPRFFRLDSDVAVEWIYLQSLSLDIWHSDTLTCTHCQTRALQPCLPSSLSCTGQWKRVQEGPWLFSFFVFLFVCFLLLDRLSGISEGQHNLWAWGSPGQSEEKKKSMKEQKGRRQVDWRREVERVESGKMLDICEGRMGWTSLL